MGDIKEIVAEIAEMDFVYRVLVLGKDGSLHGEVSQEDNDTVQHLGASVLFACGALTRLGEVSDGGVVRHALIEFKGGIVFLADLGAKAVLGIFAKSEVNRGYLLSRLPFWSEQLRDALG